LTGLIDKNISIPVTKWSEKITILIFPKWNTCEYNKIYKKILQQERLLSKNKQKMQLQNTSLSNTHYVKEKSRHSSWSVLMKRRGIKWHCSNYLV